MRNALGFGVHGTVPRKDIRDRCWRSSFWAGVGSLASSGLNAAFCFLQETGGGTWVLSALLTWQLGREMMAWHPRIQPATGLTVHIATPGND